MYVGQGVSLLFIDLPPLSSRYLQDTYVCSHGWLTKLEGRPRFPHGLDWIIWSLWTCIPEGEDPSLFLGTPGDLDMALSLDFMFPELDPAPETSMYCWMVEVWCPCPCLYLSAHLPDLPVMLWFYLIYLIHLWYLYMFNKFIFLQSSSILVLLALLKDTSFIAIMPGGSNPP